MVPCWSMTAAGYNLILNSTEWWARKAFCSLYVLSRLLWARVSLVSLLGGLFPNNVIVIECIHWGYGFYIFWNVLLSPIYQLFIISFYLNSFLSYTLPLLQVVTSFCAGV